MALPIINLHLNVNPLAEFAVLQSSNTNRKAADPKSTVGDRSLFRIWFWDIAPGNSNGSTVRQNDLNFNLVGKKTPWDDDDEYLVSATDFTEGGDADAGWFYETEIGFDEEALVTVMDAATGDITLKIDVERRNPGNTQRLTSQFDWKVRKQVYTGGVVPTGSGIIVYPGTVTPGHILIANSAGNGFVEFPAAARTAITGSAAALDAIVTDGRPSYLVATTRVGTVDLDLDVGRWILEPGTWASDGLTKQRPLDYGASNQRVWCRFG